MAETDNVDTGQAIDPQLLQQLSSAGPQGITAPPVASPGASAQPLPQPLPQPTAPTTQLPPSNLPLPAELTPYAGAYGPPNPPQQQQQPGQLPPRPVGTSVASQPMSKAQFFRQMLGEFFYSAGTGLANAGHGPGSFGRGMGYGMTAIPELRMQQEQLEIARKNAEAMQAYHNANANLLQTRAELVQVPMFGNDGKPLIGSDGNVVMRTMPRQDADRYLQGLGQAGIRAGAVTGAATIKANAGQVAITADVAKSLGLSPDTVGKSYTAQEIRALTPKDSPNKIASVADGIWMVDGNTGAKISRLGDNPSVTNAREATRRAITVEDMRNNQDLLNHTLSIADADSRAQYNKETTGIQQWAADQRKTGYAGFPPPNPTGDPVTDAQIAEMRFKAGYQKRMDTANQKLLDATEAARNKFVSPGQQAPPAAAPTARQFARNKAAGAAQPPPPGQPAPNAAPPQQKAKAFAEVKNNADLQKAVGILDKLKPADRKVAIDAQVAKGTMPPEHQSTLYGYYGIK